MYLILPVPVVLRLMALILQLSEVMDDYVNIESIQVRARHTKLNRTQLIILKLGLQFTGFLINTVQLFRNQTIIET